MPIKNFYTATTVEPGDVFVVTIKAMVRHDGTVKLYRCPWPNAEIGHDGTPQGDELYAGRTSLSISDVASTIFPILSYYLKEEAEDE
jgi:hypothetical protein